MNRTEDESIDIILRTFQRLLKNIENDEVLYKDENKMKAFLADMIAETTTIKTTIDGLRHNVRIAQESEQKAKQSVENKDKELNDLWQKHEQLLLVNREYRRDYTSKPVREVVKIVPMRNAPRDSYDMPELCAITENLIFRKMHDPHYLPDELFDKKYKSKLKTTLHLDIDILKQA